MIVTEAETLQGRHACLAGGQGPCPGTKSLWPAIRCVSNLSEIAEGASKVV